MARAHKFRATGGRCLTAMDQSAARTWDWMDVLEARSAHAILGNLEYDAEGVLTADAAAGRHSSMTGALGMPPSVAPRFRDVLNRGFPRPGRWVFLDEIAVPPGPSDEAIPVACMVYWDASVAGWRRCTAITDCRPHRNVPQPWRPLGDDPAADATRRAACETTVMGDMAAGIPDLFCRSPAYIRRRRPGAASPSDDSSGEASAPGLASSSPSARSSFCGRIIKGQYKRPRDEAPAAPSEPAPAPAGDRHEAGRAVSSNASAPRAAPIPKATYRLGDP